MDALIKNSGLMGLINHTGDAVIIKDSEGVWAAINPSAQEMFGISKPQDYVGLTDQKVMERRRELAGMLRNTITNDKLAWHTGEVVSTVELFSDSSGSIKPIKCKHIPVFRDGGLPYCMYVIYSELLPEERFLNELDTDSHGLTEEVLRVMFNSSYVSVFLVENNTIVWCNKMAAHMLGGKKEQIYGRTLYEFSKGFDLLSNDFDGECTVHSLHGKTIFTRASVKEVKYTEFDRSSDTYLFKTATAVMLQDITELKIANVNLEQREKEMLQLYANVEDIRKVEREEMARDIHDELGSTLTGLKMTLNMLEADLTDERLLDRMSDAVAMTDSAIKTVKSVSRRMQSFQDSRGPLCESLRYHALTFCKKVGLEVDFETRDIMGFSIDTKKRLSVLRIAQEALTNIAQHAHATKVRLAISTRICEPGKEAFQGSLMLDPSDEAWKTTDNMFGIQKTEKGTIVNATDICLVTLTIADDGVGMPLGDLDKHTGVGLKGMRRRAEEIEARIEFGRNEGQGSNVTLTFLAQLTARNIGRRRRLDRRTDK